MAYGAMCPQQFFSARSLSRIFQEDLGSFSRLMACWQRRGDAIKQIEGIQLIQQEQQKKYFF
jgi:hypothetical protein